MPTLEMYKGKVYLWKYVPSLIIALVFTGIFVIATAFHVWKTIRTKMWFCIPFVIGGLFEVIGYVFRAISYNATGDLVPYLMQSIFLLLAPIFYAATLYMVYSRLVRAVHGEHLSLIPIRWTTRIFVCLDFFFLSIQSDGGGLLAKEKTTQIGTDIIIAGLILQVLAFLAFMACCIVFHRRFGATQELSPSRRFTNDSQQSTGENVLNDGTPTTALPWRGCLYMLYATSIAVLARNLYRIVEFVMGTDGYLQAHEWPVYALDGGFMLIVMIVFYIWHPSTLGHGGFPSGATAVVDQRESMIELTGNETPFGAGAQPTRTASIKTDLK